MKPLILLVVLCILWLSMVIPYIFYLMVVNHFDTTLTHDNNTSKAKHDTRQNLQGHGCKANGYGAAIRDDQT